MADAIGACELAELLTGEATTVIADDNCWESMRGEGHSEMLYSCSRTDIVGDPDVWPFAVRVDHDQ